MKNLLVTTLLCLMAICSYGQTKHLTIMGIPITGSINTFQQKLLAKNYRLDTKENKSLPVGLRAFKGKFSGNECSLIAYYFPESKTVHKVKVSIGFLKAIDAVNSYYEIKKNLLVKYRNAKPKTGGKDGSEFMRMYIEDDTDMPLGIIDLFVDEGEGDFESELVIGYKDVDSLKEDFKNRNDL